MREQAQFKRPTMAAPAPGFTERTMARIQLYERARARRRAMIGAGLLAITAAAVLLVVVLWLGSFVVSVIASPDVLVALLNTVSVLGDTLGTLTAALWIAGVAFVEAGSVQLLVYALVVCGLLLIWVRIVGGPFQWLPHTISSGDLK